MARGFVPFCWYGAPGVTRVLEKEYLTAVPLERLREWDKNYRSITPQALLHLKNKIQELGIFKPLLAIPDKETNTFQVIGGNQRLRAYRELGYQAADIVLFPKLTDKKIIAKIALADNQSDGFTEPEKLLELCQDAELTLGDLQDFELADATLELADIFPTQEVSSMVDDNTPALAEGTPFSQPGDVFILGRHRLICGDSTKAETLAQLMGDEQADMLLTDPPYNVNYEGTNGKKIANDSMSPAEFATFLCNAMNAAAVCLRSGAAFYVWYAEKESVNFRHALENAGLTVRQGLVWIKNHFVVGRQDYQWKHEPCLYGWKDGAPHYFVDDRTQSTVLEFPKPQRSDEHPTMKPVALMAQLITNSTKEGQIVLDPFGGSGSTLMACELKGRVCRMVELDPRYCDVILKRFMLEAGEEIQVLRGGQTQTVYREVFHG